MLVFLMHGLPSPFASPSPHLLAPSTHARTHTLARLRHVTSCHLQARSRAECASLQQVVDSEVDSRSAASRRTSPRPSRGTSPAPPRSPRPAQPSLSAVARLRRDMRESAADVEADPERFTAPTLRLLLRHASVLDAAAQALQEALVARLERLSMLGLE